MPSSTPKTPPKVPALIALVGLLGAPLAKQVMADTRQDEHREYRAYRDLNGVWTICDGTAHGVKQGDIADDEQCDAKTAADLLISAKTVLSCAPNLKAHHEQFRAAIRFNNNTGKFCSSSAAPLFKAGKLKEGCDALLRYNGIVAAKPIRGAVKVTRLKSGKYFSVIRGLINRRDNEHKICVTGL